MKCGKVDVSFATKGNEGPSSVGNLNVLTFTQVQSFMEVLIVSYYQWSEMELGEFQYCLTELYTNL